MANLSQAHECALVGVCAGCPAHAGTIPAALPPCAHKRLSSCKRKRAAFLSALLLGCTGAGVNCSSGGITALSRKEVF